MEIIADLHVHSKYSRAVSKSMDLPTMALFAKKKGINLLTTSDWTHPLWIREIKSELKEVGDGVYELKNNTDRKNPKFILSVEVSSIYSQGGKGRRLHNLLFVPSIEVAEKVNKELVKRGANLASDGRPIVGLTPPNLIEIMMGIDERSFLIPCHVWTPWFALYGSMSGFDSIEECFGEYSKYIYGIETGLSSDPSMNWRIKELENRTIISNSDSHSPMKMGREATVFVTKNNESRIMNYGFDDIRLAIMKDPKARLKIGYTIEFFPEEGKYHYTGHRNCKVVYSPKETKKNGKTCPVCMKGLTIGVMERVEDLANCEEKYINHVGKSGVNWVVDPTKKFPSYAKIVPLNEIIAKTIKSPPMSLKALSIYDNLIENVGSEFEILLKSDIEQIKNISGVEIAYAISMVREGNINVLPGYDGEFGVVKIPSMDASVNTVDQLGLV